MKQLGKKEKERDETVKKEEKNKVKQLKDKRENKKG